ncbi:AraC family transcriptional regulator [Flavobacterium supellecticarium]|uniref:AraC family transcriptional regulator n=1 Tax=Flavobacterium supellecticarium TaxID=2565924 RepID=A0A4S3ZPH2_9FLAO|nr:helix-turn-helix domain-containing protein [Flavobacterium supellecticarium]THF47408.1 AraC family transcriptional regulator [Flavobacterium supellecticarium]
MLFLLLALVFGCNALTLYVLLKTKSDKLFDKVIRYVVWISLFHSAYAFLSRYYFEELPFIDRAAPFGLLYGPMLYFLSFSNHEKRLGRSNVIKHGSPFLVATIGYVIFLISPEWRRNYGLYYFEVLYSGVVVSMVGYVLYVFLNHKKAISDNRIRKLINSGATWLLLIASLLASIIVSKILRKEDIGSLLPGMIIYGAMLFVSFLIFKYSINNLLVKAGVDEESEESVPISAPRQYQKSALTVEILREYEQKLNTIMETEQVFLDTELSLESLSRKVKIPKHHLTQLFNTKINQTFYQYINMYRINHSCKLLLEEPETNLEEIAFKSGFNSKVTFNRYFKNQMGCTPSEYR